MYAPNALFDRRNIDQRGRSLILVHEITSRAHRPNKRQFDISLNRCSRTVRLDIVAHEDAACHRKLDGELSGPRVAQFSMNERSTLNDRARRLRSTSRRWFAALKLDDARSISQYSFTIERRNAATRRHHRGSFCSLIKSKVMLNRPNIDRDDARSARAVSIPLQISAFQRDLGRISRCCFLLFSSFARVCVFARCRYRLKEKLSCGIFRTGNCEWAGIFCSTAGHVEFEIKREISSFLFHRFLPCRHVF